MPRVHVRVPVNYYRLLSDVLNSEITEAALHGSATRGHAALAHHILGQPMIVSVSFDVWVYNALTEMLAEIMGRPDTSENNRLAIKGLLDEIRK